MHSRVRRGGKKLYWTGLVIGWLVAASLLLDGVMKLVQPRAVVEGTQALGYARHHLVPLGVILLTSTVLYLIPKTRVLGAILLTGYLGGAVASNFRVDHPLLGYTLFPVYVGVLIWLALYLRDERLRALLPFDVGGTADSSSQEQLHSGNQQAA